MRGKGGGGRKITREWRKGERGKLEAAAFSSFVCVECVGELGGACGCGRERVCKCR